MWLNKFNFLFFCIGKGIGGLVVDVLCIKKKLGEIGVKL